MPRVDGHQHVGEDLAFAHHGTTQGDAVEAGAQLQVVLDVNRRWQKADFLRELAANALDPVEQVATAVLVDQLNQAITHFQTQGIDGLQVLPAGLAPRCCSSGRLFDRLGSQARRLLLLVVAPRAVTQQAGHRQEDDGGHAWDDAEQEDDACSHTQHLRVVQHLAHDLGADVLLLAHAGHHHGGGHRYQQGWNLSDQGIANGQQDVGAGGFGGRQTMLHHADDEATNDVDEQDQDAGDGITPNELGGTIHGAMELGLFSHLTAAAFCFGLVDQARIHVGVNGHLLAGHRVQGEAGTHFGNTLGTLGDHDEVDHDKDGEHDQADGEVTTDQKVAERLDDCTGSACTIMAFHQHHACRGHVQRQAQQGGQQQHGREGRKVQRPQHRGSHHHHHQGGSDVECEKQVQQERRQRQHHQRQDGHHHDGGGHGLKLLGITARQGLEFEQHRVHASASVCMAAARAFALSDCWGSSSRGTSRSGRLPGIGAWPLRA